MKTVGSVVDEVNTCVTTWMSQFHEASSRLTEGLDMWPRARRVAALLLLHDLCQGADPTRVSCVSNSRSSHAIQDGQEAKRRSNSCKRSTPAHSDKSADLKTGQQKNKSSIDGRRRTSSSARRDSASSVARDESLSKGGSDEPHASPVVRDRVMKNFGRAGTTFSPQTQKPTQTIVRNVRERPGVSTADSKSAWAKEAGTAGARLLQVGFTRRLIALQEKGSMRLLGVVLMASLVSHKVDLKFEGLLT